MCLNPAEGDACLLDLVLVAGAQRLLSANWLILDLEGPSGVSCDGVGGGGV